MMDHSAQGTLDALEHTVGTATLFRYDHVCVLFAEHLVEALELQGVTLGLAKDDEANFVMRGEQLHLAIQRTLALVHRREENLRGDRLVDVTSE